MYCHCIVVCRHTGRWMDAWIHEWMEGWSDEQIDGWMKGCADVSFGRSLSQLIDESIGR